MARGIIALDIDGTLTNELHTIHADVISLLTSLHQQGWQMIFITGRTFTWGYQTLKGLSFPYHLSVQNGAILVEMPSRKIIKRKYLDQSILSKMDEICTGEPTDFVIYSGIEDNDNYYYRPNRFSPEMLKYVTARCKHLDENWTAMDSFDKLHLHGFASVKCFGEYPSIERISNRIETEIGLHAPPIKDPFQEGRFVSQATHPEVNKGFALGDFISLIPDHGLIIAAGDDNNDLPMLQRADIKIAMANAPRSLLGIANIIAPPASQNGILTGLKYGVSMAQGG